MKQVGIVIFVAALSGCGGNAVCDPSVLCPGRTNASYTFCNGGADGCYYVGSDGSKFRCASCGDCASAQQLTIGWCVTAPATTTTGETCQTGTCTNGKSYQYCTSADTTQCRYTTSDAKEFRCTGCSDCTAAASALQTWCGPATNACAMKPTFNECYDCCRIANPAGDTYVRNNVWPCFCNDCSFDCGGSMYCGGTVAGTTTACQTCVSNSLQGSCGPWINACMADASCKAYFTCASACQ